MGELETVAAHLDGFIPPSSFQGLIDAFSYVEPVPSVAWPGAQTSLISLAAYFKAIGGRLPANSEFEDAKVAFERAASVCARSSDLFAPGRFYMPRDPRLVDKTPNVWDLSGWDGVSASAAADEFELLRREVLQETIQAARAAQNVAAEAEAKLRAVDRELQEASSDARRQVLSRLVRQLHPDSNAGREKEVLPAFQYAQRLRSAVVRNSAPVR
eukprot:TRINITY_DN58453_c0_g1_i1.p2 TRINITY_DN58453_c0_g1~~TRINITY_DN58453_c0_g1_i1.p2  ORF type:complete len:250 (-),score=68.21 TRINITY_DN58453_c0_g1_i1:653-1294(-)